MHVMACFGLCSGGRAFDAGYRTGKPVECRRCGSSALSKLRCAFGDLCRSLHDAADVSSCICVGGRDIHFAASAAVATRHSDVAYRHQGPMDARNIGPCYPCGLSVFIGPGIVGCGGVEGVNAQILTFLDLAKTPAQSSGRL